MNGKRAKQLRRMAEKLTVDLPDVAYIDVALNPRKPDSLTRKLDKCTRGFYQELKRKL